LQEGVSCAFCCKQNLEPILCVVACAKDVYPIEHTRLYHGHYHVLGCLISPLEGKTAADLDIHLLLSRLDTLGIVEVILALDSTLAGDTTSLYIQEQLKGKKIKITKLASGVPLGSSLDFIDEGTLSQAFHGRQMIWQDKM
jgi:recombination protein RecR